MRARRIRRGATLIEVATASLIFVLMLTGLVAVGMQAGWGWASGASQVMVNDASSTAIQAIARDVRNGIRCSVSADGKQATVTMPYVNSEGDYDRYTDGNQITYYVSSGTLMRQVGSAAATALARNVTSVSFQALTGKLLIQITSQRRNGNRSAATTLSTQVAFRNDNSS